MQFSLKSPYQPAGDQHSAIRSLVQNIQSGTKQQVLLGVTGSGKTFTVANVIQQTQKPTLVISHNKTLAAQLYQEFKQFFPNNAVSYFVSYYDYYQPEAYIPQTDTYIEKSTDINQEIDMLRLQATTNLLTRQDTIVIASVSCIYNLGSPDEYGKVALELAENLQISREQLFKRLNDLFYVRSDFDFKRGTFRIRGENIDIYPAYEEIGIRISHDGRKIIHLTKFSPLTGETILPPPPNHSPTIPAKNSPPIGSYRSLTIHPAKHFVAGQTNLSSITSQILADMEIQQKAFLNQGKLLEANRIHQRVTYDMEMLKEVGYVNGIENYSRYFDGRKPGDPPYSLLDYFPKDYLLIIDESHITLPQIRGMYHGDRSRKQTLIDFGFRLPSALDNRPLKFDEFQRRMGTTIYLSATPDDWEVSQSGNCVVEQLIRPTGLLDPEVTVLPTEGQVKDLINRINSLVTQGQRALITTLTKRMAEDLSTYLGEQDIKVHYLHSDIDTLERLDILNDLRSGKYDVVVGINLLREGLDLPEVSLVAILDADKEGFLRSKTSLVQTMGRAARHVHGQVVMYADSITNSMRQAIDEVSRRRAVQIQYNLAHQKTPQSIVKPLRDRIVDKPAKQPEKSADSEVTRAEIDQLTPEDRKKLVVKLKKRMLSAAKQLDFELAASLRDQILLAEKQN